MDAYRIIEMFQIAGKGTVVIVDAVTTNKVCHPYQVEIRGDEDFVFETIDLPHFSLHRPQL